jgi:uncharacterized protein YjeT (DUF2065 family)
MTFSAQQSRVDALLRLVGIVTLFFGAALVYLSAANANVGIAPEIITLNIALGVLLIVAGGLALFAKFK